MPPELDEPRSGERVSEFFVSLLILAVGTLAWAIPSGVVVLALAAAVGIEDEAVKLVAVGLGTAVGGVWAIRKANFPIEYIAGGFAIALVAWIGANWATGP